MDSTRLRLDSVSAIANVSKVIAQSNLLGAMMAYKFELYTDKAGETRFRFKASNGEIMFSSEGYKQKKSAQDAIASIQKNASGASVDDKTGK